MTSLKFIHMKKEIINQLYKTFEQHALDVNGIECWSARELQKLLGYSKWENFSKVIDKVRDIEDYLLTRYACFVARHFPTNGCLLVCCAKCDKKSALFCNTRF